LWDADTKVAARLLQAVKIWKNKGLWEYIKFPYGKRGWLREDG